MKKEYREEDAQDIETILSNGHVNGHFQILARELDILEPKLPEDIYKTWLETGMRRDIDYDSIRSNLASSFVTAFVHAGFGEDKLMANTKDCWVYKNKVIRYRAQTKTSCFYKRRSRVCIIRCAGIYYAIGNRVLRSDTSLGRGWWISTDRQVNVN